MARIRSWAGKQSFPALRGVVQYYTRRGRIICAKWPRSRSKTPHPNQVAWHEWFKQANHLAKICDPNQIRLAMEYTRGTGLYPRDLLLKAMSTGIVDIIDITGPPIISKQWGIEPVTWQGFIIEANPTISVGSGPQTITWPLPTLQTMPFWNAGDPTVITIPPGVTVMEFYAAWLWNNTNTVSLRLQIQRVSDAQNFSASIAAATGRPATSISTGPVIVTPGETWNVRIQPSQAGQGFDAASHFKGTILQAT